MYSIPLFLLEKKSNLLSQSDFLNHQNFCKLFSKAQSTYERKLEDTKSKKSNKKYILDKNDKDLPSKIWSWFENLSFKEKVKICTIKSKLLLKILLQLYIINYFSNKTTFEPTKEMSVFFNNSSDIFQLCKNLNIFQYQKEKKNIMTYNEDDYYSLYFTFQKNEYIKKKSSQTEEAQYMKKLLSNIVILSLEDKNSLDTFSLHENLLKDKMSLKQIFNFFSKNECFKHWLLPIFHNNYNYYNNFCYPIWMHNNTQLSLCQIITGIFEQNILLEYEYYYYTKKLYFFPNIESIMEIYEENKNLKEFFSTRNKKEEKIIKIELLNDIVNNIKSNVTLKKKMENFKKMLDQIRIDFYRTEFYTGDNIFHGQSENIYNELTKEMEKYKEKGKEYDYLLNKITFMSLNDIIELKGFIFINLRKYLIDFRDKENLNDLLNYTNIEKVNKKKKKKKKKNKNTNMNNNNNENLENKNIIVENNNEHNFSSIDENESSSNINSCSSNSLKIKENQEIANIKEEKIKNKGFFLFPINTKKNKNKNNENISNTKFSSEKNNIKINYISNKEKFNIINNENKIIINDNNNEESQKKEQPMKSKSKIDLDKLSENSIIRFEMLNSKKIENKIEKEKHKNQYISMNSPESTTSFSFEASKKEKQKSTNEDSNQNNKININENDNKNQINMTINIINNQYIYQQYPFINFNFNNLALMQSQFFYYYQVPSDEFFEILSKEIKTYESFTSKNIEILDKIRNKYYIKVEKMIEFGLNKKYEIKFGHYGSFFTNLSIEGSDVDIRVYYRPLKPNLDFLNDIIYLLNEHEDEFENINPILSASVPVIVLQINISNEINNSNILKFLSYFEKKDISHINIDLTFTSDENEFKRPGQIVNYINKCVKNYEDIRPLLLVVKRYFRVMKMNKSFTGGLSSYSLFLLILAFLKDIKGKMSLGKLLYYFMEKYSFFDYKNYGIDVEGEEYYFPLNIINFQEIEGNSDNIYEKERKEEIKILDPFTKLNVAKSSFQLDQIKCTFNKALYFLKFESWKFQSCNNEEYDYENDFDFTIIKKLFSIK